MLSKIIGTLVERKTESKLGLPTDPNARPDLTPSQIESLNVRKIEAPSGTDAIPGLDRFNVPTGVPNESLSIPPRFQIHGYQILGEVGRGGQAVIFEARQISTGQKVAIKVLLNGMLASTYDLARFDREVHLLAALNHPNIVRIIDQGVTEMGIHYLVMAYVEGVPLTKVFQDRDPAPNGSIPDELRRLLALFIKICDAVNAAHLRGVVHRDLKPANIIIDENNDPHILDFGLARTILNLSDLAPEDPTLSVPGQFIGSLPWASPEQAQGQHDKIDTRSDVYSLGVILYQILTGRFPYDVTGPMHLVIGNIVNHKPNLPLRRKSNSIASELLLKGTRSPYHILLVLDAIALKALSKDRNDRYQTAGELAREITECLSGRPTTAHGDSGISRRRFNALAMAIPVIWLVLLSVVVGQHLLFPSTTAPSNATVLPPIPKFAPPLPAGSATLPASIPLDSSSISPAPSTQGPNPAPNLARPRVIIGVAAAFTKVDWLNQMAQDFAQTDKGLGVEVRIISMNSVMANRAVLDVDRRINLSAPINSFHNSTFANEWRRLNGQNLVLRAEKTGTSPMVFLAKRTLIASLPGGEKDLTFRWIHDHMYSAEPGSTASKSAVRFGFGNPLTTGSGISQLVIMAYELNGKSQSLSAAQALDTRFVQPFVYDGTRQFNSIETLMNEAVLKESTRFDVVFLSEAAVIRKLIKAPDFATQMQVVYPRYNIANDEPIYILNVPWSNADQRTSANDFVDCMLSEAAQRKALDFGMRPVNPDVRIDAPDSPFVRFSHVGIKVHLDPLCDPPSDQVIESLESAWRMATPEND